MRCEACGLCGVGVDTIQVRTTNGALSLCRQCLDDINRKNPALAGLKYKCGCAAVPSSKVKAFCPQHNETLAEAVP